jgi:hypothetical protein
MTHPKRTILLIHGAWHSPAHFAPFRTILTTHEYPSVCPQLPSYNSNNTTLYDDASTIVANLTQLVVMHSYGGMVGTQAIDASFSKIAREKEGKAGGVLGLLYMCAFIVQEGQNLVTSLGEAPPFTPVQDRSFPISSIYSLFPVH